MGKILVTGACGQLGGELVNELESIHGKGNVIASDIADPTPALGQAPFEHIDVMDRNRLEEVVDKYDITIIYHLAALLSARAEQNIELGWKLNMDGLLNVLNIARDKKLERIFWPSSIAVFGPDARKDGTPQNSQCNPATVYGITKLAGEQWCAYYHKRFGVDVRSLRYPGLIGYKSLPGGGTTDYAVDIYHKALKREVFECFLSGETCLPMMYMPDAVKATVNLMQADGKNLTVRSSYNLGAISFTPDDIAKSIRRHFPDFKIVYAPDYRQEIADSWPDVIDDSVAQTDWNWKPSYDLNMMTDDILENLPQYFGLDKV
jgi:nucleoside-diphosphate-sugar epimerase